LKRRLWLAALAGMLTLAGCGQKELAPLADWGADLPAARAEAAKSGRPLAILFSAPWSDVAGEFERGALADPRVKSALARFVRVRLNLDQHRAAEAEYGVAGVPCLVLLSRADDEKKAERKLVRGSLPAEELAQFLATLGPWGALPGWESEPAAAEKQAADSGKPLAVLYSVAWEPAAAAFEREVLGDRQVQTALDGFTLLRLNLAANAARARADKVASAPTLLLPAAGGARAAVSEKCPAEMLAGFIAGLAGWQQAPGWGSDHEAGFRQARDEKKPLALVLDAGADWPSYKFLRAVLESAGVKRELDGCVRVRLENAKVPKQLRKEWQVAEVPSLVIFDSGGARRSAFTLRGEVEELSGKIAGELKAAARAR
jgi:thiol:disulfide interchange protein